jgi:hypothetical protein
MKADDLTYPTLQKLIKRQLATGRSESASFLKWFLENIYRLDDITADDAICDNQLDKGIDGIYVDHALEEIHFLQSKVSQKPKSTVGDVGPKNLIGSLKQFATRASIQKLLGGNAHGDLKKLVARQKVADFVEKGYARIPVYVTNQLLDADAKALVESVPDLRIFDRSSIARDFVDFNADEGIKGSFSINTSYAQVLKISVPPGINVYQTLVEALNLINLKGISDTTLFKQNVRLSLGNTPVNKAIRDSILNKGEHKYFPLYHNGITILCESVDDSATGQLRINNYVVVNGAQSLTTFLANQGRLTSDLKIFVKIVSLRDTDLSRKISTNTNNQNAIKARDLRANHDLMTRLQAEFRRSNLKYNFEVKRGEEFNNSHETISNEDAGRYLLAFDLSEPFSCHQIYKVFDEKYAEIFGRPAVDCFRISFLHEVMSIIEQNLHRLKDERMAKYTLTKFLVMDVVAHILRSGKATSEFLNDRNQIRDNAKRKKVLKLIPELVVETMLNLDFEVSQDTNFDYKAAFKSPEQVKAIRERILLTHRKDVAREKAVNLDKL